MGEGQGRGQRQRGQETPGPFPQNPAWKRHRPTHTEPAQPSSKLGAQGPCKDRPWEYLGIL